MYAGKCYDVCSYNFYITMLSTVKQQCHMMKEIIPLEPHHCFAQYFGRVLAYVAGEWRMEAFFSFLFANIQFSGDLLNTANIGHTLNTYLLNQGLSFNLNMFLMTWPLTKYLKHITPSVDCVARWNMTHHYCILYIIIYLLCG